VTRHRLFVLAAALLWSSAGAGIKACSLNGWQIAFGRSLVAAVVLFALVPEARRLPSRAGAIVALAYAATVTLFVFATKATTAANAIFLQDTAPLWVMVLGPWLIGERAARSEWTAAPVFGVGLSLFFVDQLSPGQLTGNLIALGSGLAFAFTILGMRKVQGEGTPATAWGNLVAAAVTAPLCAGGPAPTPTDIGALLFLGVFQLALAYHLFGKGVSGLPAAEAALLILIEPVLNPVWTFLVTGEQPGPWAVVGGGVILAATAWRTLAPLWLEPRRQLG